MKSLITLCTIFFLWIFAAPAWADDGAFYTGEPRLRMHQGRGSVKIVSAAISMDDFFVTVQYEFKNNGPEKIVLDLFLDIPPFSNRGAGNWYPDRSFSELAMSVNGETVRYQRKSIALCDGKDVTDILKEYELTPNDVGDIDRWTEHMTDAVRDSFSGLIAQGIMNEFAMPKWSAANTCTYALTLPPGKTTRLSYTYKALPGTDHYSADSPPWPKELKMPGLSAKVLEEACGGAAQYEKYQVLWWMQIPLWLEKDTDMADYFDLRIAMHPLSDTAPTVILVGTGGKIHSGKGTLRLHFDNFRQEGELWLAVFNPYRERGHAPLW